MEAEAFLEHATMHNSNGMVQDDELHPGPFDGNIDHESERDGLLTIHDLHSQPVDTGDDFEDFDMIDLDGNVFTRDPSMPSASHKWGLQVGGLLVEKGSDMKQVAREMQILYPDRR